MAGPARRGARGPAKRRRSARPVLGNDPFERGAAPRAPAPAPVASRRGRAPTPAPRRERTAAGGAAARLDGLEVRLEGALHEAEAKLAAAVRRAGSTSYPAEARELIARLLPALRDRLRPLTSLAQALASPGPVDAFGMDPRLLERVAPILDFLYESWWRVAARGLERVPPGPGVIVANHGGAFAWDALVLRLALQRPPAGRELRPLLDEAALKVPLLGAAAERLGAVRATPENAAGLLGQGKLVAVFPEGSRQGTKAWGERYRLQWFGRGGFAQIALRAGAPIVPCAVVGSEEATAPVSRSGWLGEFLGLPFLAMAPALPLGPLGILPLPSRWSLRFGEPVETRGFGPRGAEDPATVNALSEQVRAALQRMLDEDVAARRSAFL